jgi:predicted transcriptional regulator
MSIISLPKKRILEELKQNSSHGYVLSRKLNLPLSSIYEHIKELREAKLIDFEEKRGRKVYWLTEKGEMLLEALE